MWSSIRITNLCHSWETTLSTTMQCFCTVYFSFSFTGLFPSFSTIPPIPFSEVVSHICNSVEFSCPDLHSFLGSLNLLNRYFKTFHTLKFTIMLSWSLGFDPKFIISCIHHYNIMKNSVSILKVPCASLIQFYSWCPSVLAITDFFFLNWLQFGLFQNAI